MSDNYYFILSRNQDVDYWLVHLLNSPLNVVFYMDSNKELQYTQKVENLKDAICFLESCTIKDQIVTPTIENQKVWFLDLYKESFK